MCASDAALYAALSSRLERELRSLPDKPEETARSTLHALWHLAAGRALSADAAVEHALPALDDAAQRRVQALVDKRLAGTPLAHLTGRQRFMGLEMLTGPQALIPRRETELLARAAVELLQRLARPGRTLRVLDVCTGSANVAAAMASAPTPARIHAADLSHEAIQLAARNLEHLGLGGSVELRCGDLLAPFDEPELLGQIDLITCNPPYISDARRQAMEPEIRDHEPELAFDGGPLGIRILNRLIRQAPRWLRDGGWLAIEVGVGQGRAVLQRLRASKRFSVIEQVSNVSGEPRVRLAMHSVTR